MADETSSSPLTEAEPEAAVRDFFERLGHLCAAVDYDGAEPMFSEDVVSFGTKARVVQGRKRLRREQWEGIWENIEGFTIDLDSLHCGGSGDHAWGMAPWSSTGFDDNGRPYSRPGRATVVLKRRGDAWEVVHTHFSLAPGTPPHTFGRPSD